MAEAPEAATGVTEPGSRASGSHLSIGEVLALLLEEFPDVTISKIRFLESQGLIEPERTASGYRKFYDVDVELLRCILREQKDNFLPLKVIKDRLDTGEIDPTSEIPRPRGIMNLPDEAADAQSLAASRQGHPAARTAPGPGLFERSPAEPDPTKPAGMQRPDETGSIPMASGVVLDGAELCSMSGIDTAQLDQLESYGLIVPDANKRYDEDALEIARIAKRFLDLGVDARHLRGWRVAADREAGLYEQMIQPLIRQRNPQSNEHALAQLTELDQFGAQLRSALMRTLLRQHFER
ncbi:transcriptional regulator FtsR [Ilumatobacter coccineus]|uniref:Putative MerR family transcriptional regulator n=1 Tax=Ilumatobacter coccineus (strain NBRC 103263 / KCTC 29153 / YM16-304) TaxID=1313172 RepID=A0A6C7ECM8_ILUCY|nr:MerR family transcriptional regulator [Ilumatobacter coccineus]BAN02885.1 putative MerR family transcriptional regulator [Ilumatobacter coccineus YM16-304]